MRPSRPQCTAFDYEDAISRVQQAIDALRSQYLAARGNTAQPTASSLGTAIAFVRAHRGSLALVMMLCTMSAGSVMGALVVEARLQSETKRHKLEQQQLQGSIDGLRLEVQQQTQLLERVRAALQRPPPVQQQSPLGGRGWLQWRRAAASDGGAGALRMELRAELEAWKESAQRTLQTQRQKHDNEDEASKSSSQQSSASQNAAGMRVGPLGRGFVI